MDLFPTASALAGVPLPTDRVYDGRDMSDVLLKVDGKSKHEVLFMYGGAGAQGGGPGAARMGPWKAYWATGPGLGGCDWPSCRMMSYPNEVMAPLVPLCVYYCHRAAFMQPTKDTPRWLISPRCSSTCASTRPRASR